MKYLFGFLVLIMVAVASAANYGRMLIQGRTREHCPSGSGCICFYVTAPVCSTVDCTFQNECRLKCAGHVPAYNGTCGHRI